MVWEDDFSRELHHQSEYCLHFGLQGQLTLESQTLKQESLCITSLVEKKYSIIEPSLGRVEKLFKSELADPCGAPGWSLVLCDCEQAN